MGSAKGHSPPVLGELGWGSNEGCCLSAKLGLRPPNCLNDSNWKRSKFGWSLVKGPTVPMHHSLHHSSRGGIPLADQQNLQRFKDEWFERFSVRGGGG